MTDRKKIIEVANSCGTTFVTECGVASATPEWLEAFYRAAQAEALSVFEDIATLKLDAERYRWLIAQHWVQSEVDWRLVPTYQESTIKQLGEAIDAARGAA